MRSFFSIQNFQSAFVNGTPALLLDINANWAFPSIEEKTKAWLGFDPEKCCVPKSKNRILNTLLSPKSAKSCDVINISLSWI